MKTPSHHSRKNTSIIHVLQCVTTTTIIFFEEASSVALFLRGLGAHDAVDSSHVSVIIEENLFTEYPIIAADKRTISTSNVYQKMRTIYPRSV